MHPSLTRTTSRPKAPSAGAPADKRLHSLKLGIWVYFLLLIFEGALRKWVLPGLSTPLLIVRDPIALWLIVMAQQRGLLPSTAYLTGMTVIGFTGIITAVLLGHGNLLVALYGARVFLLHFPLIFIIGRVFDRADVIRLGQVMLYLAMPMALLIAMQFYSPQSAWVNVGIGGDTAGSGFSGALGYFRPSGTFSFTSGNTLFFSLVGAFTLYFWLDRKAINTIVLIGATVAFLFAIPLSISRALFFQAGISLLFLVVASIRKPKYMGRLILALIGGTIALQLLSQSEAFGTATAAFTNRFEGANESEGGLEGVFIDRFLGGLIGALTNSTNLPLFGMGMGMGTNVGSMLLVGSVGFLVAEGEWGRVVGELGPLMGISVIWLRVSLTGKIASGCYRRLKQGDVLPWMLLSAGLVEMAQGDWAQPTSLGFCIVMGGLLIASQRSPTPLAVR